ncbi:MAG: glycine--tRNA ligase subunit beta [Eggerthellaceae bacterium]
MLPETHGSHRGHFWPKSCRWGTTSEYFSRPVRWIVALLGDKVIPVRFAGPEAGNKPAVTVSWLPARIRSSMPTT